MYRIGIDARMYRPGSTGIGRYIKELMDHLFEIDLENEYVLFLNEKAYHNYKCPNQRISKRHTKADYYSLSEQTVFLQELKKENLDLVHFTHFNAPILYNGASVVTVHDLTLSKFPGQKMNTPIHRIAYNMTIQTVTRKASKIIAVSKHTGKDIEEILKTNKDKIEVVYEGISSNFKKVTDKTVIAKSKEKYRINKPYLLYVGVWRNHKNLVNLVEAFNIFKQKYNSDLQLVITGREDSKNYPEVRNAINKCDLSNHVVTPGFIDEEDLVNLYSGAEALVNPSLYEGFGFPPLEAMACGTIPIISDASCHKEICGNCAIYFDPNNINDIAEKLHEGVSNKTLISKILKGGAEHVKTFNWKKNAEETLKIYLNVIEEKNEKKKEVETRLIASEQDTNKKGSKKVDDKISDKKSAFSAVDSIKWVVGGLKSTAKDAKLTDNKIFGELIKMKDKMKKQMLNPTKESESSKKEKIDKYCKDKKVETRLIVSKQEKKSNKDLDKKSEELEEKATKTASDLDEKSKKLEEKAIEEKKEAKKSKADKEKELLNSKAESIEEAAKKLKEASDLLKMTSKELKNQSKSGSDGSVVDIASKTIDDLKSKGEDIFKEHFGTIKKKIEEISDKIGEMSIDMKDNKKK